MAEQQYILDEFPILQAPDGLLWASSYNKRLRTSGSSHYSHIAEQEDSIDCICRCLHHVLRFLPGPDDLLALSRAVPQFSKSVIDFYATGAQFVINDESLRACPVESNCDAYVLLGRIVTTLSLRNVRQPGRVLSYFTRVHCLTLENIVIVDKDPKDYYPVRMERLKLLHCKIDPDLIIWWIDEMADTLRTVYIDGLAVGLSLVPNVVCDVSRLIRRLPHVRHLTLKHLQADNLSFLVQENHPLQSLTLTSDNIYLSGICLDNVRRVEIVAEVCHQFEVKLPSAEYLLFDSSLKVDDILTNSGCQSTLHTLTLRDAPENIEVLSQFTNLKHLTIINSVDKETESMLRSLEGVVTLSIHSVARTAAGRVPLILMLNDDCLINIFSLLAIEDWIAVGQIHSRFNNLVCCYMYPNADIRIDERFLFTYPIKERVDVYRSMGQSAKSLSIRTNNNDTLNKVVPFFTKLQNFGLYYNEDLDYDMIPSHLQTLILSNCVIKREELFRLFRRLDSTLTCLEVLYCEFDTACLFELHHIRELKVDIPVNNFQQFLRRPNVDNLQLLKIHFKINCSYFNEIVKDFSFCHMRNLKELCLRLCHGMHISLDANCFPCLEEIRVSVNYGIALSAQQRTRIISDISKFTKLIHLRLDLPMKLVDVQKLYLMASIRTLELPSLCDGDGEEEILLDISRNLPKLVKLGTGHRFFSLQFEMNLRKILAKDCRELYLYCVAAAGVSEYGIRFRAAKGGQDVACTVSKPRSFREKDDFKAILQDF